MGSEVDAKENFLLTKHVDVTLTIFELIEVELFEFKEAGINCPGSTLTSIMTPSHSTLMRAMEYMGGLRRSELSVPSSPKTPNRSENL